MSKGNFVPVPETVPQELYDSMSSEELRAWAKQDVDTNSERCATWMLEGAKVSGEAYETFHVGLSTAFQVGARFAMGRINDQLKQRMKSTANDA